MAKKTEDKTRMVEGKYERALTRHVDEPLLSSRLGPMNLEWSFNAPFKTQTSMLEEELFQRSARIPRADIIDRGDAFKVKIDLPGADKRNIRVRVTQNAINVVAYSTEEHEELSHNFYAKERSSEGYYRMIKLPEEVEGTTARATFVNGLLQIEVKKTAGALAKEVEIE